MNNPYGNTDLEYTSNQPESVGIYIGEKEHRGELEQNLEEGDLVDKLEDNSGAAARAIELYDESKASMEPWQKKYKRAINLAKLKAMSGDHEITEKSFPFDGASLAMLPFITESMLDFNARTAPELVWSEKIVKGKIYGEKSEEKEARAKRISDYQNYQITEGIPTWRDEQDKMLMILPCVGTAYKKTYFNYDKKQVESELYLADEVIFDISHNNFIDAPDKFLEKKYTKNEVLGFIRGEQAWDINEDELEEDKEDFEFVQAFTWVDLDGDGLKEPYIEIIWKEQEKVVALYPYYDEDTINRNDEGEIISVDIAECFTQFRFLPDPEGGPMGLGWGILFGPMFDSINTNLRQLIDAGILSNTASNSGLIAMDTTSGMGNSIQSGPIEVQLGQLTPVPVRGSQSLSQNVVQFPFAGPSPTLFELMKYLIDSSRAMTNAAVNVEANAGEAASLYLARLQQGLKLPNSITMRVYSAAKKEFKKIGLLNYKHHDSSQYNKVLDGGEQFNMQQDFNPDDCDISLVADPSKGSDIERIQRADSVLQQAKEQPVQVLNLRAAYIGWLEAINEPNIEELAPEPDPNAQDPQQQLMAAQMQMEAELKKKDQELRQNAQRLQEQKMAMEAAKTMEELGLAQDEQEARITKMYAETLKTLVDAGIASGQQAIGAAQVIENTFIEAEGGQTNGRQTQENIHRPPGVMDGEPGYQVA